MIKLLSLVLFTGMAANASELDEAERAFASGEFSKAARILKLLVVTENADALYLLGRMYDQGDGVAVNTTEAQRLYQLAADQGHYKAIERLGSVPVAEDPMVLDWYLPAAKEGDIEAQYNLGYMFETGWGGAAVDIKQAAKWYREAAGQQHDMAQLRLGMIGIMGSDEETSRIQGIALIRSAAENGNRIAEMLIQEVYDADDVAKLDDVAIVDGLRRVADEGEAEATEYIFSSIEKARRRIDIVALVDSEKSSEQKGELTQPLPDRVDNRLSNVDKAVQLLDRVGTAELNDIAVDSTQFAMVDRTRSSMSDERNTRTRNENTFKKNQDNYESAERGDANAQFQLGVQYMQGQGVERDYEEGIRWLSEAADQNHESAQLYLQLWDNDFEVGQQGDSIGVRWLKEAARALNVDALYRLGFLYESGRGVIANEVEANKWYQLAVSQGHQEAKKRVKLMSNGEGFGDGGGFGENGVIVGVSSMVTVNNNIILFVSMLVIGGFVVGGSVWLKRKLLPNASLTKQAQPKGNVGADDLAFMKDLWTSKDEVKAPVEEPKPEKPRDEVDKKSAVQNPISDDAMAKVMEEINALKEANKKQQDGVADVSKPTEQTVASSSQVVEKVERTEVECSEVERIAVKEPLATADSQEFKINSAVVQDEIDISSGQQLSADIIVDKKISRDRGDAMALSADDISLSDISRDNLATGRISADVLVKQGMGMGKLNRKVRQESSTVKLDAGELMFNANVVFDKKIPQQKNQQSNSQSRVAVALCGQVTNIASQQNKASQQSKAEVHKKSETHKPVDINDPFTDQEERSLAEVHLNIGLMFLTGDGVPQNNVLAAKWYEKSAKEGLPEAQFNLSELYQRGDGVLQDQNLSLFWLKKAAEGQHKEAQIRLMHLGQSSKAAV